jgi:hypothetical protein
MPRKPFVRIASLGMAGATALFAAPGAVAVSPALTAAPMQINHLSHGLHTLVTRNGAVESDNWSGYAATGDSGAFTSVSASWTQSASETDYSNTVKAGDSMSASVVYHGSGRFVMTISDSTQGWSRYTEAAGSSGYQDDSAEVIAEAPYDGEILPLADFGTVNFSNAKADGNALGGYSPNEIIMVGNSDTKAQRARRS